MGLNLIYIFFGVGPLLALASWIGFGLVKKTFLRVLLRTGFVSFFLTPSIVIGHGFIPAPAFLVIFVKNHFLIGLVPVIAIWVLCFTIVLSIPRARQNKTKWPPDYASALLQPPYLKLPMCGLIFCLTVLGSIEYISDYWYFGFSLLLMGAVTNYFLCLYSSRRSPRIRWILPLLFPTPVAAAGLLNFAILCSIPGLAGVLVTSGKRDKALWLGAATSLVLLFSSVQRTIKAIKYQDVPHIKYQGGVALAVGTGVLFLGLGVLFSILARRSQSK